MPSATLSCTKNVTVSSKYTANSYRNGYLGFGRGSANDEYRLLLDFTAATSTIPSGVTIEKATLIVPKTTGSIGSNAGFTVTANRITSAWSTGSSWGSGNPSYTDTGAATAAAGDGHSGNISFDVTAIVQAWMSGSAQYGILLRKAASGGTYIKVAQELGSYISVTYGYKASSFSTDGSATAGIAESISVSAQSSALTHDLVLSFGGKTWMLHSKKAASAITTWTPPMEALNQIPNTSSGNGTLTLNTYNGSTLVGSTQKSVTISVPAAVVPSISSLSAALAGNETVVGWGIYLKNYSKVKLTANGAAGTYGSTIKSYNFSGNGWSAVATANTVTSATLVSSGDITFTVTVTDSRGRTSDPKTVKISAVNYSSPAFTSASAVRANSSGTAASDGTYILVQAAASYSAVGKNALSITASVSPGGWSGTLSGGKLLLGSGGAAVSTTYAVTLTAKDTLGSTATRTLTVFPVERIFNVTASGDGAAFGGYATSGKLTSFWPTNLVGAVEFGDPHGSRNNLNAAIGITLRSWQQDYTRSVIGLCRLTHSMGSSTEAFSSGRVTIRRANAVHAGVFADVLVEDGYGYTNGYMSLLTNYRNTSTAAITGTGVRPCAFQYNGTWYCGLEYYIAAQGTLAYFYGQTNDPVNNLCFVPYYHTSNGILNNEVYNSLTYSVAGGYSGLNFNGTSLV